MFPWYPRYRAARTTEHMLQAVTRGLVRKEITLIAIEVDHGLDTSHCPRLLTCEKPPVRVPPTHRAHRACCVGLSESGKAVGKGQCSFSCGTFPVYILGQSCTFMPWAVPFCLLNLFCSPVCSSESHYAKGMHAPSSQVEGTDSVRTVRVTAPKATDVPSTPLQHPSPTTTSWPPFFFSGFTFALSV